MTPPSRSTPYFGLLVQTIVMAAVMQSSAKLILLEWSFILNLRATAGPTNIVGTKMTANRIAIGISIRYGPKSAYSKANKDISFINPYIGTS